MTTFSTSAKPLPFYADGETPLETLVDKFGSRLESLDNYSKFVLLATIAVTAAVDDEQITNLELTYECIEQEFLDCIINTDLIATGIRTLTHHNRSSVRADQGRSNQEGS